MKGAFTVLAVCGALIACGDDPVSRPTGVSRPQPQPPPPTFVLFGTVQEEGGMPLEGAIAEIVSSPYQGQTSISNASGHVSFAGISGEVTIRVYRDGFSSHRQTFNVVADFAFEVRLSRTESSDTIRLGRMIESAVLPGADPCDPFHWDARAPCRRFDFTAPRSGMLEIVITWDGTVELDATIVRGKEYLATSNFNQWGELWLAARVEANMTYQVRVNSYYSGQPFKLQADLR